MKKFLIASVVVSLLRNIALGQAAAPASASPSPSPAGTEETERVIVQSQEMDSTRESIVPSLGATRYTVGPDRLDSQAEGENAPFNQTLLRFPGHFSSASRRDCTDASMVTRIAVTTSARSP